MGKADFSGIFCLPVTPFKNGDDEVDEDVLRQIVDVIVDDGVTGLVPTGATGEFPFLLHEERKRVQDIVLDQTNGKALVLAGTGATNTKEALIFTKYAQDIGCDGVMLSHPVLMQANDEQTYQFFAKIASSVEIPILMYNNPGLGRTMSPGVIERLADDFDNVVAYKEDDFNAMRFGRIIRRCRDKLRILTGYPGVLLEFLTLGAHGCLIAEYQAFPHLIHGVMDAFGKGDKEGAMEYHEKILEMFRIIVTHFVGASFPARYKATWRLRGLDINLDVRHPHNPVTAEQLKKATPEFERLGIKKIA
jgi:dihydrodipicolinate synthase/N-acetylneuraminate lyase